MLDKNSRCRQRISTADPYVRSAWQVHILDKSNRIADTHVGQKVRFWIGMADPCAGSVSVPGVDQHGAVSSWIWAVDSWVGPVQ